MSLRTILRYPDSRLHKIAKPVTVFDDRLKQLVADMAETMYEAPGIGLAATQIDVHEQVIVLDVSETRDQLQVLKSFGPANSAVCTTKAACPCPAFLMVSSAHRRYACGR